MHVSLQMTADCAAFGLYRIILGKTCKRPLNFCDVGNLKLLLEQRHNTLWQLHANRHDGYILVHCQKTLSNALQMRAIDCLSLQDEPVNDGGTILGYSCSHRTWNDMLLAQSGRQCMLQDKKLPRASSINAKPASSSAMPSPCHFVQECAR